jgi:DNA-binding response OmpR family regulator
MNERETALPESGIVLLLEDNQKILNLNRKMLEDEGVMVLTATTIAMARQRVRCVIPDVVVLDIMLPDGSGLDFLAELRAVSDVPALFLTAKAERADIIAGLTAGGNDYITKPYDIDEFCARVTGFLRLTGAIKKRAQQNGKTQTHAAAPLTEKELSAALLAAKGLSNKEIGKKLFLSESRVKTCFSEIYKKLGLADKDNKRELLAEMLDVK